jgi:hypothetical protein
VTVVEIVERERARLRMADAATTLAVALFLTTAIVLGGAWLLAAHHVAAALWGSLVLLGAMLVMVRNVFGVVSLIGTGAAIFAVAWSAPAGVQTAVAYAICWFLLLAGARPVVELQRGRRRGLARDSDADQLARLTGVPGVVWVGLFGLVAAGALLAGARWLVA